MKKPSNSIYTKLVTTQEEMTHSIAVRSICFMLEHGVKADQLYDGNDYLSSHVVTYDGDEPIGTARIRWFNGFAKVERASIRPDHRSPEALQSLGGFIFEVAARKGYQRVLTHASPVYARMWCMKLGFEKVKNKSPVYFTGHEPYIEIVKFLQPLKNAITHETDPTIMFRQEGSWEEKSIFESKVN